MLMHQRMKHRSQLAKVDIQDNWIILIMFTMIPHKSLKTTTKNTYHNRAKICSLVKKSCCSVCKTKLHCIFIISHAQQKTTIFFYPVGYLKFFFI